MTGLHGSVFAAIVQKILKGLRYFVFLPGLSAIGLQALVIDGIIEIGKKVKEWYNNGGKYYVKVAFEAIGIIALVALVATAIGTLAAGALTLAAVAACFTVVGGITMLLFSVTDLSGCCGSRDGG